MKRPILVKLPALSFTAKRDTERRDGLRELITRLTEEAGGYAREQAHVPLPSY